LSYQFDVFISYARDDGKEFAAKLTEMLRAAGLAVWLDVERMPPGVTVNETLAEGLRKSQCIVYLITERWLARDYPQWEHDVFVEQGLQRCQVPVSLVLELKKESLGPGLSRLNWLTWLPESDVHAVFWQVYCGLLKLEPGPESELASRGRRLLGLPENQPAANFPAVRRELFVGPAETGTDEEKAILTCDRHQQWGELTTSVSAPGNQAIFVIGPERQAHQKFLDRVDKCLPKDPPRRIRAIVWNPRRVPVGRGPFIEALCVEFKCSESQLAARMRADLAEQNLVLMHQPVAQNAFDRDDLLRYYTEWLPDLAEAATAQQPGRFYLKAVQAVEWLGVSWWAELGGWLRPERAELLAAGSSRAARRLLANLQRQEDPRLPLSFLAELGPIGIADVESWCRQNAAGSDRFFLERIREQNLDSAAILEQIEDLYGPYRRQAR
jgi:hypothetical protein